MPAWCRNVNSVPGKILSVGTNVCDEGGKKHTEITSTVLFPSRYPGRYSDSV